VINTMNRFAPSLIAMPYGMGRRNFHMKPDAGESQGSNGGAGGGGEGGGANGSAAGDKGAGANDAGRNAGNDDMVPRSEAKKAFKDRDKAKAGVKLFATVLGIDPDDVEITETGDKDNPFELNVPGLDDIKTLVAESKKGKKTAAKDLEQQYQEKAGKLTKKHNEKVGAYESYIKQIAAVDPIRNAAVKANALPEAIDDIVSLLSSRVRVETEIEDETNKLTVKVTPMEEDGTVLLDSSTQKTASIDALVKSYLDKRPHFRKASAHNGPGAGGQGNGSGQGNGASNNGNGQFNPAGFLVGR
jgi:hypothetical protein